MRINVLYRISSNSSKVDRESYITKENCLKNALRVFPPSKMLGWIILGDALNEETEAMIRESIRGSDDLQFIKTELKNTYRSFNLMLDKALELSGDEIVYFLEDDYLHIHDCPGLIEEGLVHLNADYVSLYDMPDKYIPDSEGGSPFVDESAGELTKVFRGRTCHWRLANSTTMTFAVKGKTLQADADVLRKWARVAHHMDFSIFLDLWAKGRVLMTPLPGASTHGDRESMSPYRNWKAEV